MNSDILILGNGTVRHPELVDTFPEVVRINSARRGPARGSKMTQWAVPASMIDRFPSVRCSNVLMTLDPREGANKTTMGKLAKARQELNKRMGSPTIRSVPIDVTSMLMQRVDWPTTGLVVVWHYMLEAELRPRRIFIDGFDLAYTREVELFKCHDSTTEHEIFSWLIDNNLVHPLGEQCLNKDIDSTTKALYCPHGKRHQQA
jgi:hypothetical protein